MIDSTEDRCKHVDAKLSYMGLSLHAWALRNGFQPSMVRKVVYGNARCRFGVSHNIAVLLGLKDGEIAGSADAKADVKFEGSPV